MNVCGVTFGGYLAKILSFKTGNLLNNSKFHLLSEGTVQCPRVSLKSYFMYIKIGHVLVLCSVQFDLDNFCVYFPPKRHGSSWAK